MKLSISLILQASRNDHYASSGTISWAAMPGGSLCDLVRIRIYSTMPERPVHACVRVAINSSQTLLSKHSRSVGYEVELVSVNYEQMVLFEEVSARL